MLGGPDGWGGEEGEGDSPHWDSLGDYSDDDEDDGDNDGDNEMKDGAVGENRDRGGKESDGWEDGSGYEVEREGNGGLLAEERGWREDDASGGEGEEEHGERDAKWQHLDHLLYLAMMHR